jgi:hypothetical protein
VHEYIEVMQKPIPAKLFSLLEISGLNELQRKAMFMQKFCKKRKLIAIMKEDPLLY